MVFKSKKAWLVVLGIVSLVLSRVVFMFINDPEGPNLLIVVALAAVIYTLFLAAYTGITFWYNKGMGTNKILLAGCLVVMVAVVVTVDILFFRDHFWERLIANIGIVLVFAAFCLRFLK